MGEAAIQIDNMGGCDDDIAQHGFFVGGGNADLSHMVAQAKDVIEHVLQLAAEIIIGDGDGIGLFLPFGQFDDILHGQHLFGDDDEEDGYRKVNRLHRRKAKG